MDTMIAAHALSLDSTVVTNNTSPNISQIFCYDRGCHCVSKPSLARRPQWVPIPACRDRPPCCGKALIRSNLRSLATKCVKCPG